MWLWPESSAREKQALISPALYENSVWEISRVGAPDGYPACVAGNAAMRVSMCVCGVCVCVCVWCEGRRGHSAREAHEAGPLKAMLIQEISRSCMWKDSQHAHAAWLVVHARRQTGGVSVVHGSPEVALLNMTSTAPLPSFVG